MKISLRKAHDIQNRLQSRVNEILGECENDVDVLHEEQPHFVLDLARDRNLSRMNRVDVMINEIRDIRMSVSRLNQEVGINDLLATISAEERKATYRGRVGRTRPRQSEGYIDARIASWKDEDSYHRTSLDFPVYEAQDVRREKELARKCEKHVRELKEEVLALNIATTFNLEPSTVALLEAEDIV